MKFFILFTKKSVPEWFDCYYDYLTTKKIVALCQYAEVTKENILELYSNLQRDQQEEQMVQFNNGEIQGPQKQYIEAINQLVAQLNIYFYEYHSFNKRIVFLFCQMKIHELSNRLSNYEDWMTLVHDSQDTFFRLMMNCYAEFKMLLTMTEINLEAYRKIKKKHLKSFSKFSLPTPSYHMGRITRTYNQIQIKTNHIETLIEAKKQMYPRQARNILTEQIESSAITASILTFGFGIGLGFSVCLLLAILILIGMHLQSDRDFSQQFRIWRGIGFIILFLWVTSISSYIYNQKRLNQHLIFGYEDNKKYKRADLGSACFLSMIYTGIFVFYVMSLAEINTKKNYLIYLSAVPWILLVIYLIVKMILQKSFRHLVKSFILFLAVPINVFQIIFQRLGCCFQLCSKLQSLKIFLTFPTIWATEQLISLLIPITDSIYTFAYYSQQQVPNNAETIFRLTEILALVFFGIRFLQCVVVYFSSSSTAQKRKNSVIFIGIRCLLNIILASISLSSNGDGGYLIAWIICASIFGLFNILVDFFFDWEVIAWGKPQFSQQSVFNRFKKRLAKVPLLPPVKHSSIYFTDRILSKKMIQLLSVLNIILRYACIISFCPRIIKFHITEYGDLIITIVVLLQLIRRLLWNLLRVERQHLINCSLFRVRTDYIEKEEIVMAEVKQAGRNKMKIDTDLQQKRKNQQMETIKQFLSHKRAMKEQIMNFLAVKQKMLSDLQKQVEGRLKRPNSPNE